MNLRTLQICDDRSFICRISPKLLSHASQQLNVSKTRFVTCSSSMEYHPLMHKLASEMCTSPRSIDAVGFVVSSYGCSGKTPSKFSSLRLDNSHITNVW